MAYEFKEFERAKIIKPLGFDYEYDERTGIYEMTERDLVEYIKRCWTRWLEDVEIVGVNDHRREDSGYPIFEKPARIGRYNEVDYTVGGWGFTTYFEPMLLLRNYHIDTRPNQYDFDTSFLGGE